MGSRVVETRIAGTGTAELRPALIRAVETRIAEAQIMGGQGCPASSRGQTQEHPAHSRSRGQTQGLPASSRSRGQAQERPGSS